MQENKTQIKTITFNAFLSVCFIQ